MWWASNLSICYMLHVFNTFHVLPCFLSQIFSGGEARCAPAPPLLFQIVSPAGDHLDVHYSSGKVVASGGKLRKPENAGNLHSYCPARTPHSHYWPEFRKVFGGKNFGFPIDRLALYTHRQPMTNLTSNKDLKTFVSSVPAWRYSDGQQCSVEATTWLWCSSQFSGAWHSSSLVLGAAVLWWWSSEVVQCARGRNVPVIWLALKQPT